jgi:hypothetical protein
MVMETYEKRVVEVLKYRHENGLLESDLDLIVGAMTVLQALDIEVPVLWQVSAMCGRLDRLYITEEE